MVWLQWRKSWDTLESNHPVHSFFLVELSDERARHFISTAEDFYTALGSKIQTSQGRSMSQQASFMVPFSILQRSILCVIWVWLNVTVCLVMPNDCGFKTGKPWPIVWPHNIWNPTSDTSLISDITLHWLLAGAFYDFRCLNYTHAASQAK